MNRRELGKQGEEMVEKYIVEKGYELLGRNYLKRSGEIDIIALDPSHGEIVFIEVKTRRSKRFGFPEEAVTKTKLEKIQVTAENWLEDNNKIDFPWRIDIIALEIGSKNNITHIENVTI